MQDGVSLIEPAGLRVNNVLHGAPGKRSNSIFNLRGTDLHDGGGTTWIEESAGIAYRDDGLDRSDGKLQIAFDRNRRSYLQRA